MNLHEQARAEAERLYPVRSGHTAWIDSQRRIAHERGYRAGHEAATRTRVVTTVSELDALPVGSVVIPADYQTAIQRTMEHEPAGLNWSQAGDPIGFTVREIPLPARVLYEPKTSQDLHN